MGGTIGTTGAGTSVCDGARTNSAGGEEADTNVTSSISSSESDGIGTGSFPEVGWGRWGKRRLGTPKVDEGNDVGPPDLETGGR